MGRILPIRMRKRLRYLMPSLPQSLIVRLVIPRVVSPPELEDRDGEKNKLARRKQLKTCYTTWTLTGLWA